VHTALVRKIKNKKVGKKIFLSLLGFSNIRLSCRKLKCMSKRKAQGTEKKIVDSGHCDSQLG
jgi:aspartate carbamoyltransferase regulatory subunit